VKSFLAVTVAALALLIAAAPASSMPIRDHDGAQVASQRPAVTQPTAAPLAGDDHTDDQLVLLVAGAALLAGAGLGFTVAHRLTPA
jgi:hypothetical protein